MHLFYGLKILYKLSIRDEPAALNQNPIQDVAPRAVRIADAIDAMICTIHFRVSFLVMISLLFVLYILFLWRPRSQWGLDHLCDIPDVTKCPDPSVTFSGHCLRAHRQSSC